MKKLKYLCLTMLALFLLAIPAAAQKGSRSNKHGANRGDERAGLVRSENENKKKDNDKDRDPDNDKKNKGKHKGETKGKHKGHRH